MNGFVLEVNDVRFITGDVYESKRRISSTRFVSEGGERYSRDRVVDAGAHASYYIVHDNSRTSTSPVAYRDIEYALAENPCFVEYRKTSVLPGCPSASIGHEYGQMPVNDLDDTIKYMLRDDVTDDEVVIRFPRLRIG